MTGVLYGQVMTAVAQAVLGGIGYAVVGVKHRAALDAVDLNCRHASGCRRRVDLGTGGSIASAGRRFYRRLGLNHLHGCAGLDCRSHLETEADLRPARRCIR